MDIAGSAWPLYKLQALVVGLVVGLLLLVVTSSVDVAVLAAAGAATLRWVLGSAMLVGSRHAHHG
ncbi:hypothetical protein GCM10011591_42120 [Nocardia camponoti]|uniref:Uncharacterized protein n=1 Tax=Nocardia camponoti TaxID=1616106 RepID=A0A917VDJ0_9NOCA|nr:hypothetical protein GCM10011591_42120 [Nocardia camponoti]